MSREDFGDPFGREFGGSRDFDDLREQMARKRDEFFNDRGDHGFFSSLVCCFFSLKVNFCLEIILNLTYWSKKAKSHSLEQTHTHTHTHMVLISWAFPL